MGANESILRPEDILEMQAESNFTAKEIKRFYKRFKRLDKEEKGSISTEEFMAIPELSMNPLKTRIIQVIDSDKDGLVNFKQFVRSLNVFHPQTPRSEKIKFMFQVYDIDGDGVVSRKELTQILRMMVGTYLPEENIQTAVDHTMEVADPSGKGVITFENFEKTLADADIVSKMSTRFIPASQLSVSQSGLS
eukprot:TRINITY_DN481_c0_g1_i1.p1 TRINITY_DN481_c0_g1~~TRINITY_DN481_c0_g1_i1.p1  ORF type:complete len:192 (+),score=37.03 TRINITY_DN481_c0_g1_i1:122-697(+)